MGSMNMPGISLTLLNLTNVSEECSIPVEKLLELLDAPHRSPAWPTTHNMYPVPENLGNRKRQDAWIDVAKEEKPPKKESKQILGMSMFLGILVSLDDRDDDSSGGRIIRGS
jgi:dihydroxyacetone kinase